MLCAYDPFSSGFSGSVPPWQPQGHQLVLVGKRNLIHQYQSVSSTVACLSQYHARRTKECQYWQLSRITSLSQKIKKNPIFSRDYTCISVQSVSLSLLEINFGSRVSELTFLLVENIVCVCTVTQ